MPSDLLFNNNIPAGNWDDPEENSPYAEFQDIEDYPQYYQPACQYLFRFVYQYTLPPPPPPPPQKYK